MGEGFKLTEKQIRLLGKANHEFTMAINTASKEERPFYFEFSINEKVAMELAYGATGNCHPWRFWKRDVFMWFKTLSVRRSARVPESNKREMPGALDSGRGEGGQSDTWRVCSFALLHP